MENIDNLDKLLIKIIDTGGFQYFWSFHTLTFNITEKFNKENLQNGIKIYSEWLTNMFLDNELDKFYYIYVYEITQEYHIHIHLLLNKILTDNDKEYLIKKWNKYNDWDFYNQKGLVIKNDNEYDNIKELNMDKKETDLKKLEDKEATEKRYYKVLKILKYIYKNINDFEILLKLYYMIYPIRIVGGILKSDFIKYIQNLNILFLRTIYNFFNLYNPFLNEKEDESNLLKYIYMKWKKNIKADFPELIELLEKIQNEKDKKKRQKIIEDDLLQKEDIISECKLYCMKRDDFKILQKDLLDYIDKNIYQNDHYLIFFLEKKENTIYYILETLIKIIRFYKKNLENEKKEREKKDQEEEADVDESKYEFTEDESCLEKEFFYTESYFKFVMQNLYQTQIISVNLENQRNLFNKRDENFLNLLKELSIKDLGLYKDLIVCYESQVNNKNIFKELYIKYQLKIETAIGVFIDDILNILYELHVIKKNDLTEIIYIKERNQNYFSLTEKFLNYLILEAAIYDIILPLLTKPKNYELDNDTKLYKGGYQQLSNVLFSENENLEYQMSEEIINLINKSQEEPLFISKKYFNYLLQSNVKVIEKITGFNIKNFEKNYLDKEKTVKVMKQVPKIFLLHEFFLTIYLIEIFQNDEIWFISKLDERGRKYDVGYPLNFYRDKFFRNVFLLNKQQIANSINESICLRYQNYKNYYNYISIIFSKEKSYNLFNILQNPLECIVGFDAKNQIYQILGGLLKNKKLLQLSHVIDLNTLYSKNDVYDYFSDKLWKVLHEDKDFNDFLSSFNKLIIKYKKKENKFFEKMKKSNLNILSIGALSIWFDRDWIKHILMTYGYNKGLPGLIAYTYNIIFNNTLLLDSSSKMCNKLSTLIVTKLIKLFNEEIDSLKSLKLLFNGLISLSYYLKEPIYISLDNKTGFYQYYTELEKFSFRKWKKDGFTEKGKPKWKRIRINYIKLDDKVKKIQLKKGMNAILPNMCHYIDSLLMYNILNKVLEDGISIKTIHDSFYLNIRYKEYIHNLYYEKYIEIFNGATLAQLIINALKYLKKNAIFNDFIVKFNINLDDLILNHEFSLKKKGLKNEEKEIYQFLLKIKNNYKAILNGKNYIKEVDLKTFILNNKHEKIII